ncbi:MAG: hypothetical protein ACFFC1_22605 [Promethearchaeota archaeon]
MSIITTCISFFFDFFTATKTKANPKGTAIIKIIHHGNCVADPEVPAIVNVP